MKWARRCLVIESKLTVKSWGVTGAQAREQCVERERPREVLGALSRQ